MRSASHMETTSKTQVRQPQREDRSATVSKLQQLHHPKRRAKRKRAASLNQTGNANASIQNGNASIQNDAHPLKRRQRNSNNASFKRYKYLDHHQILAPDDLFHKLFFSLSLFCNFFVNLPPKKFHSFFLPSIRLAKGINAFNLHL